jgi:hypothetical protein
MTPVILSVERRIGPNKERTVVLGADPSLDAQDDKCTLCPRGESDQLDVSPEIKKRAGQPIDIAFAFVVEEGRRKAAVPAEAEEVGQRVGRRVGNLVDPKMKKIAEEQPVRESPAKYALDDEQRDGILPTVQRQDDHLPVFPPGHPEADELVEVVAIDEEPG